MEQRITEHNSHGQGASVVLLEIDTRYRRYLHMLIGHVTSIREDNSRKIRILIAYKHHLNKHQPCIFNPPPGASYRSRNNVGGYYSIRMLPRDSDGDDESESGRPGAGAGHGRRGASEATRWSAMRPTAASG
jgi:hypothetical protein